MGQINKKCSVCGVAKPEKDFYIKTGRIRRCRCKKCESEIGSIKRKTKAGLILSRYNSQLANSKKRGHPRPSYTWGQFLEWVMNHPMFDSLYDDWVRSGYEKSLSPSIDRVRDNMPYSFENIQLLTWGQNRDKGHEHRRAGLNNNRSSAVIQCDMSGAEIKVFYSMSEAARCLGVNPANIWSCCNGSYKSTGGYKWKYKNQEEAEKFNHLRKNKK